MLDSVVKAVRVLRALRGVHPRTCPACGYHGKFRAFGFPPRFDAVCPRCHSLERHRLLVLADQRTALVRQGAELLHVAPEAILRDLLRPRCRRYVTLDAYNEADIQRPLEDTGLPAASFDHVLCCHVLEHIDDRRALTEIARVLKPGGSLIAMMPVIEGWDATYEDHALATREARDLHFGQHDHVRIYGRDVRARFADAGFTISEVTAEGPDVARYALTRGEKLFVGLKAA